MIFTDSINNLLKMAVRDDSENAFNINTYLDSYTAFRLKYRFSNSKQKKFLTHFLSIRGTGESGGESKQIYAILTKMSKIYEASGSKFELEWAAATLIRNRVGEGYSLSKSMSDIFSPTYISIMQALETNASSNVAVAVKVATESAISLQNSIRTSRVYSLISIALIGIALKLSNISYNLYLEKLDLEPKKMEFVEFPEFIFMITSPLGVISIYAIFILALFVFLNALFFEKIPLQYRLLLEEYYYPPAFLYKAISSVRIFSSLSLLVSIIGMQTKDALRMLLLTCNKYEAMHLNKMLQRLQNGEKGTLQLDTGLLSKEIGLSLKMANEGESATVRSALQILSNEGQSSLVKSITRKGQILLITSLITSVVLSVLSGGLVLQVYLNLFL
ncbi:hypothetical protein G6355_11165 [Vibrio cholerae]|uniref:hypothetical protein n=1 Tax=Vibrio cholerae TaxID=666 RepID=UPI002F308556